jgi:hypothetical protein
MGKINKDFWKRYEVEKKKIFEKNLSPDDYEREIIEIKQGRDCPHNVDACELDPFIFCGDESTTIPEMGSIKNISSSFERWAWVYTLDAVTRITENIKPAHRAERGRV